MMIRKSWLWTLAGMIALAAVSYAMFLWFAPPVLPEGFLYGNGRIEATEVTVSAEVTGRVLESSLTEGRLVKAGDLLVRLDETDLRTRLAQAEEQARTWHHHLRTAEADLARYRKLYTTGDVAAQALDRTRNQEQEARGRLETARREADFLRSQLGKAVIRAPVAGTILTKGIEAGEFAVPGRTVAVLADMARLELRVYIPETEIGRIKLNDPARVRVDAFPDRYFEARVARVDTRSQFTPKDVHMPDERARLVFGVTLGLDNPGGPLKPGMPADAWMRWQPEAPWPARLPVPR